MLCGFGGCLFVTVLRVDVWSTRSDVLRFCVVGGLFCPGEIRVTSVEVRKRINLYLTKDSLFF